MQGGGNFTLTQPQLQKRTVRIAKFLRTAKEGLYEKVQKVTTEIANIAQKVVEEARGVRETLRHKISRTGSRAGGALRKLDETLSNQIDLVEKVINQTRKVINGERHIADRIVSLFDPGARPIQKGKLKSPTEFGRKLLLSETEEGIISHYEIFEGNPADKRLLLPAVQAHRKFMGKPPWAVVTDRGFYSAANEKELLELGVSRIRLPKPGKKGKTRTELERQSFFRRLQRFRANQVATISHLKRSFGLGRSLFRGDKGSREWVGLGIMARNLWKAAILMR